MKARMVVMFPSILCGLLACGQLQFADRKDTDGSKALEQANEASAPSLSSGDTDDTHGYSDPVEATGDPAASASLELSYSSKSADSSSRVIVVCASNPKDGSVAAAEAACIAGGGVTIPHDGKGGWYAKQDRMYLQTLILVNVEIFASGERKLLGSKTIELKTGENKASFEI